MTKYKERHLPEGDVIRLVGKCDYAFGVRLRHWKEMLKDICSPLAKLQSNVQIKHVQDKFRKEVF